ncbi:MAG: phage major tail tube protein [Agathobacter sp.]|nr:phage major tail tube protein [Agathobacter sp.]
MKYRADKVADFFCQIKKGNSYVEIPNVVGFSIPDITPGSNEMSGAGMIGTVNIPDPCNIEAMESSVTTSDDSGDAALLNDLYNVEVILNWAIDKVGTDGSSEYIAHRAVIKAKAAVIPGGEVKKAESTEKEHKLATWYYQEDVDGVTVTLVDALAPKLIINGKDCLEKLHKSLNK